MARTYPQCNVRLAPDRFEILEAAAFVHEDGGPSKLLERLAEEAIDRYVTEQPVKKALEARREQRSAEGRKVTQLPKRRRTSP